MELQGKIGAQNKFPRVMKNKVFQDWEKFIESQRDTIKQEA